MCSVCPDERRSRAQPRTRGLCQVCRRAGPGGAVLHLGAELVCAGLCRWGGVGARGAGEAVHAESLNVLPAHACRPAGPLVHRCLPHPTMPSPSPPSCSPLHGRHPLDDAAGQPDSRVCDQRRRGTGERRSGAAASSTCHGGGESCGVSLRRGVPTASLRPHTNMGLVVTRPLLCSGTLRPLACPSPPRAPRCARCATRWAPPLGPSASPPWSSPSLKS